ncbi:hypothetical protein L211DRAFT_851602 [Terfezia boudieri ATCC MYA-4762]|uniref:Uncharacterized protein n=1 Tax=Terfezia boudieri ATCC MYA-4762 TaxID=1051890 RepID=A0A3N4LIG1_9PEZI|nr:hypothetical protein L211DRAFT_851602 [Terfezia boudieri ATCC MYA-4762]
MGEDSKFVMPWIKTLRVGEKVDEERTTSSIGEKKRLDWKWRNNWRIKERWRRQKETKFTETHIDGTNLNNTKLNDTQLSGREQNSTQLNNTGCNDGEAKPVKFNEGEVGEGKVNGMEAYRALEMGREVEAASQRLTAQDFVDRIHKDPYAFINGFPDPSQTAKNEAKPARQLGKNGSSVGNHVVAAPPSVIFGEVAKVPGLEPEKDFIPGMLLLKHAPSYLKAGKDEKPKPEPSGSEFDRPDPTELKSMKVEHSKSGFTTLGSNIIAVQNLVAQVTKPTTKVTGHPGVHLSTHSELRLALAESRTGTTGILAAPTKI